jgi:hypothetical protein
MYIAEATELIWIDKISGARAQTWCDLGCGTGTFTLALATLLSPGSVIPSVRTNQMSNKFRLIWDEIVDTIWYQAVSMFETTFSESGGNLGNESCKGDFSPASKYIDTWF